MFYIIFGMHQVQRADNASTVKQEEGAGGPHQASDPGQLHIVALVQLGTYLLTLH
jgi:hypothetical protein